MRYARPTATRIGTVDAKPRVGYQFASMRPPIGASHPSMTAPHDVPVGRTTTSRAMAMPSCRGLTRRACKRGANGLDGRFTAPGAARECLGQVGLLPREVQVRPA